MNRESVKWKKKPFRSFLRRILTSSNPLQILISRFRVLPIHEHREIERQVLRNLGKNFDNDPRVKFNQSRSFPFTPGKVVHTLACSTKSKVQNRRRRYRSLNRQSKAACAVMRQESTYSIHFSFERATIVSREKPVIIGESNVSRDCKTPRDRILLIFRS